MTSDEYATLMDFLATRFARIDAAFAAMDVRMARMESRQDAMEARLEALEARLTRAEVLRESMRDDVRRVAEGVVAVNERLDRFQVEINARMDDLERGLAGVHVRFDRFAVDFGTVQLDQGARLEVLERWRRECGPGG